MKPSDIVNPLDLYEDIFEDHQGQVWGFEKDGYQLKRLYRRDELDPGMLKMVERTQMPKPTWIESWIDKFLLELGQGFQLMFLASLYIFYQAIDSAVKGKWGYVILFSSILAVYFYAYKLIQRSQKERKARIKEDRKVIIALQMKESEHFYDTDESIKSSEEESSESSPHGNL